MATGTLALGIHMPCKTVVFAGDSLYLNSVQYRQVNLLCSGFEIPSQSISLTSVFFYFFYFLLHAKSSVPN